MKSLWYKLTGWWPRKLPQNLEEVYALKTTLVKYFKMPDNEKYWLTLYAHIGKFEPSFWNFYGSRCSYRNLALIANHLTISSIISEERSKIMQSLQEQLKAAMEKQALEEKKKDETRMEVLPPHTDVEVKTNGESSQAPGPSQIN